ncbi:hypothetical protein PCANC_12108 [Puccinia coronata f. sp. avenae]|uniref:Tet-like 2OG-Fe(II) oxygenase domain-containing protein n=1 Tax=Puccinia coronata f. sp. avenae TaxID=200324 RepID=A0A2N5UWU8_9BASI|nr:hypothetical protein PCANC_12108 [Puccinia coronata f. sp. avenae]
MAAWDQKLFIFGGALQSLGNINNPAFYHTLNTRGLFDPAINQAHLPAIKIFFALHNLDFLLQDKYLVDKTIPYKQIRPNKKINRWNRNRSKIKAPLVLPGQHDSIFHVSVPLSRQEDPLPGKIFTSQKTLVNHYFQIYKGVCIIAPNKLPPFYMAKWLPFAEMPDTEKTGWEQLVVHLLSRIDYVAPVDTNGPQAEGTMWADSWRKASKQFAPVVHNYQELLTINQYPLMNHTEYGEPYTSSDFASFLTFTMYDFHNTPHVNNNVNDWTLVVWIPIFHPKNSSNNQILADEGFDMIGDHKSTVTRHFLVLPSLIITLDWDFLVK